MLHNRDAPVPSCLCLRMQIKECFAQVTCQMDWADGYHLRLFAALKECMIQAPYPHAKHAKKQLKKNFFYFYFYEPKIPNPNIPNLRRPMPYLINILKLLLISTLGPSWH